MKEKTKTNVVFKMTPCIKNDGYELESSCIAFLLNCSSNYGYILSYMHIGQHGEASVEFYHECVNATPEQYTDLKLELESMGYDLILEEI